MPNKDTWVSLAANNSKLRAGLVVSGFSSQEITSAPLCIRSIVQMGRIYTIWGGSCIICPPCEYTIRT